MTHVYQPMPITLLITNGVNNFLISLRSKRFRASSSRKLRREQKKRSEGGGGGGGKETLFALSNFRAITSLETLATPATFS